MPGKRHLPTPTEETRSLSMNLMCVCRSVYNTQYVLVMIILPPNWRRPMSLYPRTEVKKVNHAADIDKSQCWGRVVVVHVFNPRTREAEVRGSL